jgi:hypothetical protein
MTQVIQGTITGKTIQLDDDPGLPEGEAVEVVLRQVVPALKKPAWGEGIRRSAGACADVPGFDEAFAQIERERKQAKFRDEEP